MDHSIYLSLFFKIHFIYSMFVHFCIFCIAYPTIFYKIWSVQTVTERLEPILNQHGHVPVSRLFSERYASVVNCYHACSLKFASSSTHYNCYRVIDANGFYPPNTICHSIGKNTYSLVTLYTKTVACDNIWHDKSFLNISYCCTKSNWFTDKAYIGLI